MNSTAHSLVEIDFISLIFVPMIATRSDRSGYVIQNSLDLFKRIELVVARDFKAFLLKAAWITC